MSITEEQIQANNFKDFYNRLKPLLGIRPVSGFTPVGTIIAVMGKTVPNNYIACEGQIVNIKDYPELARYFNEQFGSYEYFGGDGIDTFGIPDLRGEFLRGTGTNSHENQGSGASVGEHQNSTKFPVSIRISDQVRHLGPMTDYDYRIDETTPVTWCGGNNFGGDRNSYQLTIRPTNTSVLYCIATKNIYIDVKYDYSTDEKAIGTWIDGKTLYQRTIAFNTGSFTANTYFNIYDTSNISVKNVEGYVNWNYNNDNGIVSLNFCSDTNNNKVQWSINNNNLRVDVNGNHFANQDGYATIQYTKE